MPLHRFAASCAALLVGVAVVGGLASCTTSTAHHASASSSKSTAVESTPATPAATTAPTHSTAPGPVSTPSATAAAPGAAPSPVTRPSAVAAPPAAAYPATPVITFASWDAAKKQVEASGLVSGQIDASGVCRLTLSKGGVSVSRTSTPQESATSVSCGTFVVPGSALSAGTWSSRLSYVVGTRSATSAAQTVTVP